MEGEGGFGNGWSAEMRRAAESCSRWLEEIQVLLSSIPG